MTSLQHRQSRAAFVRRHPLGSGATAMQVGYVAIATTIAVSIGFAAVPPAAAQTAATPVDAPVPKKAPRDKYGSPLDTLMTTHLWTDVPQAEGFVRETRPPASDLDYTPLTGTDPDRPAPRDKANIQALQAELEQAGAAAQAKGTPGGGEKASRKKAKAAE